MLHLPDAFRDRMKAQLGAEYADFEAALEQTAPVSIRLNPKKPATVGFLADRSAHELVPWCPEGIYLPLRPVFTLDPLFQAGAYYVQEASSMLLAEALRQSVKLHRPLNVLDLCAAPGGKSTLLASLLSPESVLVSNEVIRTRVPVLRENLEKWGYPNVLISNHDPEDFAALRGFFDVVVVDAPCSGEGLFRKEPEATQEWSADSVALCAARQQRILAAAAPLVEEGGFLLYSTCTYNETENLTNVAWLHEQGFESRRLHLPPDWGVVEVSEKTAYGYQCYPHRVQGEGFFISVLQKTKPGWFSMKNPPRAFKSMKPLRSRETAQLRAFFAEPDSFSYWEKPNAELIAVPRALEKNLQLLDSALRQKGFGIDVGTFKGSDLIPAHALALSTAVSSSLPGVELPKEDALRYFKKENVVLDTEVRGWVLARYEGLNLGWMKGVGNRVNNYLPKDWRIRMEIRE